jgi:hypothetical protein
LRVWKCNYSSNTRDKFRDYLLEKEVRGGPHMAIQAPEKDSQVEENSGVNFPGIQFESFLPKTLREVNKSSHSISEYYDQVVIETATSEGQFIFSFDKNPGEFGRCESCYSNGMMRTLCVCK